MDVQMKASIGNVTSSITPTPPIDKRNNMSTKQFQKEPLWRPNEKSGERMMKFMALIEKKYNLKFDDYWGLHKWSVENIAELWGEIWDFIGIIYSKPYSQVVDTSIPMHDSPKWFEGARVNFAENLLKNRSDKVALIVTGEGRNVERVTYKQMYEDAKTYAAAFRKIGLKKGDRVACYMSNRKEAVVAMIAVTSIGAIWTGGLPTLGVQAYVNRLKQVNPKILITIDQFYHNKEMNYLLQNIKEIAKGLPSLEKIIIVPSKPESKLKDISSIKNSCFEDDFLQMARCEDGTIPDMVFEQLSFSDPAFISYTSGTTGLPKTIVHGFGGLMTGTRDFWLQWNSQPNDVWLSMSPVGWVSWNMINNLLFVGETIVLFEGVPYFLSPTYLWDMVDELKITKLFMTPAVLDEMEARGYLPTEEHDLSSLDMLLCGGSVVKPHNFEFALNNVKKGVRFSVGYGATELMGFCLTSEQTLPVHKGEISAPSLGIAIECLDSEGNPVIGEMGDLVISKPMPSLPLGLWSDSNGEIFRKSYFSKYPGKLAIGDTVVINPITKGIIACGRSDETLKQRGCRFGSSEIYNVVEMFPEIRDSLCVAQYSKDMDERAVLFIQMQKGFSFNDDLVQRLRKSIAEELTIRHVPEVILEAPGIPHNANGKKTEIIVKKIINKMPHNPETVANFECLKYFYNIPDLQGF